MAGLPQTTDICSKAFFKCAYLFFFSVLFSFFFLSFLFDLSCISRAWCQWVCVTEKVLEDEISVL